jgi:ribonuclease-3
MSVEALQHRLGYAFANPALLRQALTHRSHGHHNNERLEFLGDSVLNCVVSSLLYEHFTRIDEGDLSRLRANLVKQQSLYEIAQRLELSQHLLLGEGELKSGGFRRPSILGDTFEAIIGAIYLDGGFTAAQTAIGALYGPILRSVDPRTLGKDAKTLLQEHLQGRKIPLPVYSVVATHGAAHNQLFEVECAIPKLDIQVLGTGGSRRAAEQAAAKLALDKAQALTPSAARRGRKGAPAAQRPECSRQDETSASSEAGAAAGVRRVLVEPQSGEQARLDLGDPPAAPSERAAVDRGGRLSSARTA